MDSRGTLGHLTVPGIAQTIFTLEEPWQDNKRQISCIPAGSYLCVPHGWEKDSQKHFKRVWEVTNVPNRSAILIHAGNTLRDTMGCILVGFDVKQFSLGRSQLALTKLRSVIGEKPFNLTIIENDKAKKP
jgi:hypothetical protein